MTTTGYVPVGSARIHYRFEGVGPAVLFLHAGVADSRMWRGEKPPTNDQLDRIDAPTLTVVGEYDLPDCVASATTWPSGSRPPRGDPGWHRPPSLVGAPRSLQ